MMVEGEDVFYYLTLYNEPYPQPAKAGDFDEAIVKGLYLFKEATEDRSQRAQILGSGPAVPLALRAQELLAAHHDVAADVWSATSYQRLRAEALDVERWNRLHPEDVPKRPYVTDCLDGADGPVIAVTDWVKAVPDQIARWVPGPFLPLGTDGFGRSDARPELRRFFEIDAEHIVVATLSALANAGDIKPEAVTEAIERYDIDPERVSPQYNDA